MANYRASLLLVVDVSANDQFDARNKLIELIASGTFNESFERDSFITELQKIEEES